MRNRVLAAILLALAAPLHAEPLVLKPAGPWNLDVGENRCRLNRQFGEEGNRHLLAFEQYAPGTTAGMFVAGPGLKQFRSGALTDLRLTEAQPPLTSAPFTGEVEDYGSALIYPSVRFDGERPSTDNAADFEGSGIPHLAPPPAAARSITVTQGKDSVTLETGPLAGAFAALNRCSEDLIYSWGLDVEQHRGATRRPVWLNREQISYRITEEFPYLLAKAGKQAIYRMRVIVGTGGEVESCQAINVEPDEEAKSPACRLMAKAQFAPALDAAGQPMRSYFASSLVYEVRDSTLPGS